MNKKRFNFNPKNISKLFLGIFAMVIISVFTACEHDPSSLGSNLLPGNTGYRYDSTFTFKGQVYTQEPFRTSNLSYYSLGLINDDYFGLFKAEFASQFLPSKFYSKDSTIRTFNVDSITLQLAVDSIYGYHLNELSFNVYELNQEIENDYYSDVDISSFYSSDDLLSTNTKFSGDSLIIVSLSSDFIDRLVPGNDEDTIYKNLTNFVSEFNGVAIIPELIGTSGEVFKINIASENSGILMYYNDTSTFNYQFSKTTINKFAKYSSDFTGSIAEQYLNNDEGESDSLLFLQGISTIRSKIEFANIESWFDGDSAYSVLNAELFIPVFKDDKFEVLYPPSKLNMNYEYADSSFAFITDYNDFLNDRGFFDGSFDAEKQHYRFFIPKHIMQILNRDIDNLEINLDIVNNHLYPHRLILQTEGIKLKVTYTKH